MGLMCRPETSTRNYHYTFRRVPDDVRFQSDMTKPVAAFRNFGNAHIKRFLHFFLILKISSGCVNDCHVLGLVLVWMTSVNMGDQKVSVHLMITIQKVKSNVHSVPASLQTFIDTPKFDIEDRVQYSTTLSW
jgi:hypothetical protein